MTETQKEYIITEKIWLHIDSLYQALIWAGKEEFKEDREQWQKVRSRPYKSDAILDMFYGRLEDGTRGRGKNEFFLTWADIDCLYGEFKDELRQQEKGGA